MANCFCKLFRLLFDRVCNITIKRCRVVLAFICFCITAVTLTMYHTRSADAWISCTSHAPIQDDLNNKRTIFKHSKGGVLELHNFYVDDRDNPAILRGFAISSSQENAADSTPSTLYSLVWFDPYEPPLSTLCHVKDHNLPLPVLDQDYTHVIECNLQRDGDVMPNYVSITQELCGDPITYLPIRAFEQMDKHMVDWEGWKLGREWFSNS